MNHQPDPYPNPVPNPLPAPVPGPSIQFRKASASASVGHCVEVAFITASASNGNGGNNCVEVSAASQCVQDGCGCNAVIIDGAITRAIDGVPLIAKPGDVLVRDSKQKNAQGTNVGPVVVFTPEQWNAFLSVVCDAGMRYPHRGRLTGTYVIRDPRGGAPVLYFNSDEWAAFVDGVRKGEFAPARL